MAPEYEKGCPTDGTDSDYLLSGGYAEAIRNQARPGHGNAIRPFFTPDLEVPISWAKELQQGPLPPEQALTPSISDLTRLFDASGGSPKAGYAVLEGPTAYVQGHTLMPGVTTEMFKWWPVWYPLAKEHFLLWFPYAHVDAFSEDPQRLADQSLSFEERVYHNPVHVDEYIGPSVSKVILTYKDPTELGVDATVLKRAGITASQSSNGSLAEAPDITVSLILHLVRETASGLELFSRYWLGAHPSFQRFPGGDKAPALLAKVGLDQARIENMAYEVAVHDMTEFTHLASILPQLYARFGNDASVS